MQSVSAARSMRLERQRSLSFALCKRNAGPIPTLQRADSRTGQLHPGARRTPVARASVGHLSPVRALRPRRQGTPAHAGKYRRPVITFRTIRIPTCQRMAGKTTSSGQNRSTSDLADAALVAAALRGDAAAQEAIVERYSTQMRTRAYRILRRSCSAEDIAQDVLIYALSHLDTLRNPAALGAWLNRIVVCRSYSFLRRQEARCRARHKSIPPAMPPSSPDGVTWRDAELLLVALPPEARRCWWLQRVEGHTIREVATITETTIDKVKKQLAVAKRAMANYRAHS